MTFPQSGEFLPLYPTPSSPVRIRGHYLREGLHELGEPGHPFIYANFLASLDGRIGSIDGTTGEAKLPPQLTSAQDLRLLLELHAQADCFITHGGYLRAIAKGTLGDILQVGTSPHTQDLAAWRQREGLRTPPALLIVSASLDFEIPASVGQSAQKAHIITTSHADPDKRAAWEAKGYSVLQFPSSSPWVPADPLVRTIGELGYRSVFLLAGPKILDGMLRGRHLARLYLTTTHQLLGGQGYHSLTDGDPLGEAGYLILKTLYYDPFGPAGTGQWFSRFDLATNAR